MNQRLSTWRLVGFSSPFIPLFGALMPVTAFLPTLYADDLGLGLGIVGTVFMLTRFWDVFSDPVFGSICDNTRTRWGRRRPWVVIGAPLLMYSTYMLFVPPETVSVGYLTIWLLVFYTALTLSLMSMYAWAMELTSEYNERSRVMGFVQGAMLIGTILVMTLPALIGTNFMNIAGPIPRSVVLEVMGWFVVIVMPIGVLLCISTTKEETAAVKSDADWIEGAKAILKNDGMRRVVLADFFGGLANGIALAVTILFARHDLGLSIIDATQMLLAYYISGFVCIPLWVEVSRRIGKHKALAAAALLFFVISVGLYFGLPESNLPLAIVGWALLGICPSAMQFLPRAMMTDVVDQDRAELHTEAGRSGLYFAFLSLSLKLGFGLAVGIAFPLLAWLGFNPGAENPPDVLTKLRQVFFLLPAIAVLPITLLAWNFPIDRSRQQELIRRIYALD